MLAKAEREEHPLRGTHADEQSLAAHSSEKELSRRPLADEVIVNDRKPREATVVANGGGYSPARVLQGQSISSNKAVKGLGVLLPCC